MQTVNLSYAELFERMLSIEVKPGRIEDSTINVEKCYGIDDNCNKVVRWAVRDMGAVLSKGGKWEYEPIPSSRNKAFMKRFRFATFEEAWNAAVKCEVAK